MDLNDIFEEELPRLFNNKKFENLSNLITFSKNTSTYKRLFLILNNTHDIDVWEVLRLCYNHYCMVNDDPDYDQSELLHGIDCAISLILLAYVDSGQFSCLESESSILEDILELPKINFASLIINSHLLDRSLHDRFCFSS